jgi:glutaredoxin
MYMNFPEINKKHIVLLSINNCLDCEKIKAYFMRKNIFFENILCNQYLTDDDNDSFKKTLVSLTSNLSTSNLSTKNTTFPIGFPIVFPIVFLNGVYMGGYNEILEYYDDY